MTDTTESLELAFQMSNILEAGVDRHTLSLLIALCDRGVNPEALTALVRELSPATATAPQQIPSPPQTFPLVSPKPKPSTLSPA